ncbi:methyltransferase domain-containing protein [Qipengyuania sp. 1NDH17]|uniref:Methyltransferase domain-containing protein n=1 Tax=Qipengyuania polymorpha TaxID=2867234 RepID=A0ABS7IV06_9SPHN|nr:methyltransferase domain-containing protein [Qipengyuania polymorpha]MBX7457220.1 methyltransferase domain-containing protein [Qipengyuania polymorpha]
MTTANEWQDRVGESWAREWQRTDRSFRELTGQLLDTVQAEPYRSALDIGCGAGELTVSLAKANPSAAHLGLDISEDLAAAARERTAALPNATIQLGDAASWNCDGNDRPDLLVSRHGVMFFPDPTSAFAHLRKQADPQAHLTFSCFRQPSENVWVRELASLMPKSPEAQAPDPRAPGPFAFGEKDYVADLLGKAGWRNIDFIPVDYAMVVGEGEDGDAVADATSYFRAIGPAARVISELDGAAREEVLQRLFGMGERHRTGNTVSLPAACWIVTATASD